MVIKAAAAAEIRGLISGLTSGDAVRRETAIARLAIIGPRAVDRLLAIYPDTADRAGRTVILRALEAIGDPRAGALARRALQDGGDVGVAAAAVLHRLLESKKDRASAEALDALMAIALDRQAERRVRLAALDALQDTDGEIRARLAAALGDEPDSLLKRRGAQEGGADAIWSAALEGRLPEDPPALHTLVSAQAAATPLTRLRTLIDAIHEREREAGGAQVQGWMAVRGSVHQALAIRGSRVALYDLRETVERTTEPLPPSFLSALQVLGDAATLETLAAAWSRAAGADPAWRDQIGVTFRAIAKRERVSRRHAVMKRVAARWPDAAALTGG